ncbi:hypothetical protein evm_011346 [Chilo suppressalis]|nr:hypothetical protein evm_011346 [Chilo suppressalis]
MYTSATGRAPGPGGWQWGASGPAWAAPGLVDSEALIAIELCFVKGDADSEDLRIANISFNNLDIIANQETIVELIGFAQRVAGGRAPNKVPSEAHLSQLSMDEEAQPTTADDENKRCVRTEITFDFHRLGVLLVRAGVQGARKIATATVTEAKIQATLDARTVSVGGSLGGVQVVSLCEGAGVHARVLAAGAPVHPGPGPDHASPHQHQDNALLFTIARRVLAPAPAPTGGDAPVISAEVSVQVASVWYTHSGALLLELRSCLTEFKRYLANLARSIRAAAADMAITLVQPRGESLYSNPRLSQSTEGVSPRRRTVSLGVSLEDPPDLSSEQIQLSVSVELESPVVVIPRAAHSTEVLVAHLGRMSLANTPGPPRRALYRVRVRDISLATLDVAEKLKTLELRAENLEQIYDVSCGRPVLHNTEVRLALQCSDFERDQQLVQQYEVSGMIVGGLHVTARREQYEQVLETARWVTAPHHAPSAHAQPEVVRSEESLLESAVPTLQLDPALRAAALHAPAPSPGPAPAAPHRAVSHAPAQPHPLITVHFEVCELSVELVADLGAGARSLVELTFREFLLQYRAETPHETHLQVSLRSVTMEDLTKEPGSEHRLLLVSQCAGSPAAPVPVPLVPQPRACRHPLPRTGSSIARPAHQDRLVAAHLDLTAEVDVPDLARAVDPLHTARAPHIARTLTRTASLRPISIYMHEV